MSLINQFFPGARLDLVLYSRKCLKHLFHHPRFRGHGLKCLFGLTTAHRWIGLYSILTLSVARSRPTSYSCWVNDVIANDLLAVAQLDVAYLKD
ncbi:hypothetical protein PGT21_007290 [Puccinia graminis f. sp. tritici]|uniref:Uncharacterized protein n=1 Tax=Puccinia graminis f. sp. tritici TaxID=56615 RepID=A0A5B0QMB8_PUCGR|nr:hypothetical protein PGT21_007290 [Puccinia graminis f. sp. tritici]